MSLRKTPYALKNYLQQLFKVIRYQNIIIYCQSASYIKLSEFQFISNSKIVKNVGLLTTE